MHGNADGGDEVLGQAVARYEKKRDKFRVSAYVMRILKQERQMELAVVSERVLSKYEKERLEVREEDVVEVLDDLIEREFVKEEGKVYIYIP